MNVENCKKICRTCLSAKKQHEKYSDLDFHVEIYGGSIRNILQACVPELDLNLCDNNVICDLCFTLLKTAYEFKIKCLSAEEKIFQHITDKGLSILNIKVNLNDLHVNEQVENSATNLIVKEEYYISSDDDEIKPVVSRSPSPVHVEKSSRTVLNAVEIINNDVSPNLNEINLMEVTEEVLLDGNGFDPKTNNTSSKTNNTSSSSKPEVGPGLTNFCNTGNQEFDSVFVNDSGFTDFSSNFQIIDLSKSSTDDSDSDDEFDDVKKNTNSFMVEKLVNLENTNQIKNNSNNNDSNIVNKNSASNNNVLQNHATVPGAVQRFKHCSNFQNHYKPWEKNLTSNDFEKRSYGINPNLQEEKLAGSNDGRCNEKSRSFQEKPYPLGNYSIHSITNESYFNTFRHFVSSKVVMPSTACMTCTKGFSSQCELKNHIANHFEKPSDFAIYNTLNKYFICPICGKQYYKKKQFVRHFYKHKGKLPYKCKECSFVTAQKSALKTHKLVEHYSQQQHICPRCKKSFPNEYFLMYHLKHHEKDDLGRSQVDLQSCMKPIAASQGIASTFCKQCKKYFLNEYEFMLHKVNENCVTVEENNVATTTKGTIPKMKIFKCGYCCYSTTVTEQLQQHVKDHENTVMMNWQNCFGI